MSSLPELESKKSVLRERVKLAVKRMPRLSRKKKSQKIYKQVVGLKAFQKAQSIMAYAALPDEVSTMPIIREAWKLGKKVSLPRLDIKKGTMTIRQVRSAKDLRKGTFNILEPNPVKTKKQNLNKIDLILVPGIAFDRRGNRLGRGKGYYDRFLSKIKKAYLLGLAFREQMAAKVPRAPHDIQVHRVIVG